MPRQVAFSLASRSSFKVNFSLTWLEEFLLIKSQVIFLERTIKIGHSGKCHHLSVLAYTTAGISPKQVYTYPLMWVVAYLLVLRWCHAVAVLCPNQGQHAHHHLSISCQYQWLRVNCNPYLSSLFSTINSQLIKAKDKATKTSWKNKVLGLVLIPKWSWMTHDAGSIKFLTHFCVDMGDKK